MSIWPEAGAAGSRLEDGSVRVTGVGMTPEQACDAAYSEIRTMLGLPPDSEFMASFCQESSQVGRWPRAVHIHARKAEPGELDEDSEA